MSSSTSGTSGRNQTAACVALLFTVALLSGCNHGANAKSTAPQSQSVQSESPPAGGNNATVDRVVDGDTIVAKSGGKLVKIRFIGMDTPETVNPKKPVGCYGPQASAYTKSLLPEGTRIRLAYDAVRKDVYGRTLAYVYRRSDGMFINEELVRRGYAVQLTIPPNVAHVEEFTQLAAQAREQNQGLWLACAKN